MTTPDVDVVVCTRNRPALLREALAAIRAQDYPGRVTTYVVFDGGDPEHALERTETHRAVRVLGNSRSPGLAGGRNTGILAGAAPLVAFCDDDDLWLPRKLSAQTASLARDATDTAVSGIVVRYADRRVIRVPQSRDLELRTLVRRRVMEAHPSTVLVRRTALAGIGLVDEEIPGSYGEDFDWIIRAAQHGPITVVPEPLVEVRWGMSQFSQDWAVIAAAIDYGLAKHAVFHEDPAALARLLGRKAFAEAALRRPGALRSAGRALRTRAAEPRAYLAAAVALRLISARRLMDLAHRRGHGI